MATKLEGEIEKRDIIHLAIPVANSIKVDRENLICVIVNKIIYKKNNHFEA